VASAQYCTTGLYCYGTSYGDYIQSVYTTGGTSNISNMNSGNNGGSAGYSYTTNAGTLTVQLGQSFTIFAVNNPTYGEYYGIWLDLNGDGTFSSTEQLYNSGTSTVGSSQTAGGSGGVTYTVPLTATAGNTRIRVRCVWSYSNPQPCTYYGGGEVEDYPVTLVPSCPAPSFSAQPQNRTTCETASTTFSVTSSNTSTYQWQVNTGSAWANVSGGVYSGANTNTLTLSNIPLSYNGYLYRCISTGACNNPVNSQSASLTVNPGVSIASQTVEDTICTGGYTSLNVVTAGSTPSNYTWQMAISTVGLFSDVPNQAPFFNINSATLNINDVPDSLNNRLFRVIISGGLCPDVVSDPIPMTVIAAPQIIEQPQNDTVFATLTAYFTMASTPGKPVIYYWQASSDGTNFYNIYDNAIYYRSDEPTIHVTASPAIAGWWFRGIIKSTDPQCGVYHDTSSAAQLWIWPTAVNDVENSVNNITVFPNPVTGETLNVTAGQNIAGTLEARIVDKLGKLVLTTEIDLSSKKAAAIKVNHLAPGIYNLLLIDKEGNVAGNSNFTRQ
jgi:hypothetical protein